MKKYRGVGGRLCRHFSTQTTTNYQLDNLIYKLQMEYRMRAAVNSPSSQKGENNDKSGNCRPMDGEDCGG